MMKKLHLWVVYAENDSWSIRKICIYTKVSKSRGRNFKSDGMFAEILAAPNIQDHKTHSNIFLLR